MASWLIDDVAAELGGHAALGQRHADGGGDALAQRAGGGLDARRDEVFRMARRQRAELTEILDLLDGHRRIAGEIQQRIKQHRAVAGRQHETVAIRPGRVAGVEFKELCEQHGGDVGRAHGQAGMARFRLFHGVHGQCANRIGHTGGVDTHSHGMSA